MASRTDEPEANERSLPMTDNNTSSTVASSPPPSSAPPKRPRRPGASRKGSLMFTTGGSVGLGANNPMSPTNKNLQNPTEPPEPEPETNIMSYTVNMNPSDSEIGSKPPELKVPSSPNESPAKHLGPPSLRSANGRKGSLMFTTTGTVGLGSERIIKPPVETDLDKQLETNALMPNVAPQSGAPAAEELLDEPDIPPPTMAPSMRGANVRKGSLMFTSSGTVGLGANNMMTSTPAPTESEKHVDESGIENESAKTAVDNYTGNGGGNVYEYDQEYDHDHDETPVTYYTLPPPEPNDGIPVTYYTQPNAAAYSEAMYKQQDFNIPTFYTQVPQPQLLSGDNFVAQLLKAELEGNRKKAAELERRGSCFVTSGGIGGLGVEGFEDSSSDEEEYISRRHNNSLPGSEDYRPLVGGFAAAAYEAAKAHHFKTKQRMMLNSNTFQESEEDAKLPRLPPPSI